MAVWKLANGFDARWYREAGCLDYCLAHDIATNTMAGAATTSDPSRQAALRVALLGSGSNVGPSSRLMSDVTGVLGSIPITAEPSAWTSLVESVDAQWEVLYQAPDVGIMFGGEIWAYRLLDDEDMGIDLYDWTYQGVTQKGFQFTFSNDPLPPDVAYGATGTGSIVTVGSTTATTSGSHTIAAGDNLVIADVGAAIFAASGTVTLSDFTVTYGGVPMTPVAAAVTIGTLTQKVMVGQFYLLNPPAGAQTTTVSVSPSISPAASSSSLFINTVSYSGAGTPSGADYEGGTSTTANSDTVGTVAAGEMAHWVHANGINSTAFSAYNQTQRATGGPVGAGRYLIGDAVGAGAPITSTATQASNNRWIAFGCIIPKA
jgi:hypothetical protein